MANAAGYIRESIWQDHDWRQLTGGAQRLYMQLLCQRELDCAGVLPLNPHKWVKGCSELTMEQLLADLQELHNARFVVVDHTTDEVLVRTYVRNSNVVKMRNMRKAAARAALLVSSPQLRAVLAQEFLAAGEVELVLAAQALEQALKRSDHGINPSGTLPEPFPNPSGTLPEPSGVGEGEGVGNLGNYLGGVGAPPPQCSKHPNGNPDDAPCRGCMRVRKHQQQLDEAAARDELHAKRQAREHAEQCLTCNGTNWLPDTEPAVRCAHDTVAGHA